MKYSTNPMSTLISANKLFPTCTLAVMLVDMPCISKDQPSSIWQIVEANDPMATLTSIIDAGDLKLSDVRRQKDRLQLLTRMASTFDAHFPMRAHKTLIINAPSWFHLLFRLEVVRRSFRGLRNSFVRFSNNRPSRPDSLGLVAIIENLWSVVRSIRFGRCSTRKPLAIAVVGFLVD